MRVICNIDLNVYQSGNKTLNKIICLVENVDTHLFIFVILHEGNRLDAENVQSFVENSSHSAQ